MMISDLLLLLILEENFRTRLNPFRNRLFSNLFKKKTTKEIKARRNLFRNCFQSNVEANFFSHTGEEILLRCEIELFWNCVRRQTNKKSYKMIYRG